MFAWIGYKAIGSPSDLLTRQALPLEHREMPVFLRQKNASGFPMKLAMEICMFLIFWT
jgi:hypothetical protein